MKRCIFFENGVAYPLCHYHEVATMVVRKYDNKDINLRQLAAGIGTNINKARRLGADLKIPSATDPRHLSENGLLVCSVGGKGECDCHSSERNRQTAVLGL